MGLWKTRIGTMNKAGMRLVACAIAVFIGLTASAQQDTLKYIVHTSGTTQYCKTNQVLLSPLNPDSFKVSGTANISVLSRIGITLRPGFKASDLATGGRFLARINSDCSGRTVTWNGSVSSNWAVAANWTPNGIPGALDNVRFTGAGHDPVLDRDRTVKRVYQSTDTIHLGGHTLTVMGTFDARGNLVDNGKVVQRGSTSDTTRFDTIKIGCKTDLESGRFLMTTVTFGDSTRLSRIGSNYASGYSISGGNKYLAHTELVNKDSAIFYFGNMQPDSFMTTLDVINLSKVRITLCFRSNGNFFGGDVRLLNLSTTPSSLTSIFYSYLYAGSAYFNGDVILGATGGSYVALRDYGQSTIAPGRTIRIDTTYGYSATSLYIQKVKQLGTENLELIGIGSGTSIQISNGCEIGGGINSSGSSLFRILDSKVNGEVNVSAAAIRSNNTVFHGNVSMTRTGSVGGVGIGGNRFEKDFTFTHGPSSASNTYWGYNSPDTVIGDLTLINQGIHILNFAYNRECFIGGNVTLNADSTGTIYMGFTTGRMVTLNGAGNQTWTSLSTNKALEIVYDLRVNKPSGEVLIPGELDIRLSLNMLKGDIRTTGTGQVKFRDNAVVTGASDSSYVDGPVLKVGNDVFTFPVGDGGKYRPLAITAPTSTSHSFSAAYRHNSSNAIHRHKYKASTIHSISDRGYWEFDRVIGTSQPKVTIGWDSLNCGISDTSGLRMVAWGATDTLWRDLGAASLTGDTLTGTLKNSATIIFGELALASDTLNDLNCPYDPYDDCPLPNFSFTSGCIGDTIEFTDASTGDMTGAVYTWDFDDPYSNMDNSSSDTDPFHVFVSGGPFYVTLNIQGINGCDLTYLDTVSMGCQLPDSSYFLSDRTEVMVDDPIEFHYEGDALTGHSFSWDMGDGTTYDSGDFGLFDTIPHTYDTAGVYLVKFFYWTDVDCKGVRTIAVTVGPIKDECIIADFSATVSCTGDSTVFSDKSHGDLEGASYKWTWYSSLLGYEDFSIEQNPEYTFEDEGPYFVTMEVTKNERCHDKVTKRVHFINELRDSTKLAFGSRFVEANDDITFNLVGPAIDAIYTLDLGDGTFTTLSDSFPQDPFTHDYAIAGLYDVELTHGDSGCLSVRRYKVFVDDPYVSCPDIDAGPDIVAAQGETHTLDGSPTITGGTSPFDTEWIPASALDDSSLTTPDVTARFTLDYVVRVEDSNGCINFDSVTVSMLESIEVSTLGFDTLMESYETLRMSIRTPDLMETVETGGLKAFGLALPTSGLKEVRLLFHTDPSEVLAKISFLVDSIGNISQLKRVQTDPISGAETKVALEAAAFDVTVVGKLILNADFFTTIWVSKVPFCGGDNSRNWQQVKVYGNNGQLISNSRSYIDALGRSMQDQVRTLSNGNTLAMQTVTDAFGRESIRSLPAPVNRNGFCYDEDFMQATNGIPYGHAHFDKRNYSQHAFALLSGEDDNPKAVRQGGAGTLGNYYSNASAEMLVAASGFPYQRVEFYDDPLNRVKRITQAGEHHRMGKGHETKVFHMVSGGEYGSYIGDEVTKTINVDADGLKSVTYTDTYGRVKATCVSGVETDCAPHLVSMELNYQGTRSVDLHIPVAYNEQLRLPVNESHNVNASTDIIYRIFDIETGEELLEGSDWNVGSNPDNRYVSFENEYRYKDLFLRISFGYTDDYLDYFGPTYTYSWHYLPSQSVVFALDYSNWTLNEYYGQSKLLKRSIQPEGLDCDQNTSPSETLTFGTESKVYSGSVFNSSSEEYLHNPVEPIFNTSVPTGIDPGLGAIYTAIGESDHYSDDDYQDHHIKIGVNVIGFPFPSSCYSLPYESDDATFMPVPAGSVLSGIEGATHGPSWRLTEDGEPDFTAPVIADDIYNPPTDPCHAHCFNGELDADCGETGVDQGPGCGNPWDEPTCEGIPLRVSAEYRFGFEVLGDNGTTLTKFNADGLPSTDPDETTHFLYLTLYRDCECNQRFVVVPGQPDNLAITVGDEVIDDYQEGFLVNLLSLEVKAPYHDGWQDSESADFFHMFQETYYRVSADHAVYPAYTEPTEITSDDYATVYEYNDLDQLIGLTDIDRGKSEMLYDNGGRVRFSQNAEQAVDNRAFSYVRYDNAGRPIEVGEYRSDEHDEDVSGNAIRFQNEGALPTIGTFETTVLDMLDSDDFDPSYCIAQRHLLYDIPDASTSPHHPGPTLVQKNVLGRVSKTWNDDNITWYSYMFDGRPIRSIQYNIELEEYHQTVYFYDPVGNVKTIEYRYGTNGPSEKFKHHLAYDSDQRLKSVRTSVGASTETEPQAQYAYYKHGALARVVTGNALQGTDYIYTINGWLKAINSPNLNNWVYQTPRFRDPGRDYAANSPTHPDLFGMTIDYFSGDYRRRGTLVNYGDAGNDRHSGLIKGIRWNTAYTGMDLSATGGQNMYSYTYDWRKWLTDATFGDYVPSVAQNSNSLTLLPGIYEDGHGQTSGISQQGTWPSNFTPDASEQYREFNITYDRNGNIKTLDRNGKEDFLAMDRFVYNPVSGTNRLDFVADGGTNFTDGGLPVYQDIKTGQVTGDYDYNLLGLMTVDKKEGNYVTFDAYQMPTAVYWDDAHTTLKVAYSYDERGMRIRKENYDDGGILMTTTHYLRDAVGNINETRIYEEGIGPPTLTAKDFTMSGLGRVGFYNKLAEEARYELTDHLGNIRVTYKADGAGIDLLSATDYYPYGMELPGRGLVASDPSTAHGYQGVFAEKDRQLNWSTFDLRTYDGRLGKFHNVDPMWEFHSSYMAMGNNPVSVVDPTGGCTDPGCPGWLDEVTVYGQGPDGPGTIGVDGFYGSEGMPQGYGPVLAGVLGGSNEGGYFGSYSWHGPSSMWDGRAQPSYILPLYLFPNQIKAQNIAATYQSINKEHGGGEFGPGPVNNEGSLGGGQDPPNKKVKTHYRWYEYFKNHNPGGDILYEVNKYNPLAIALNSLHAFAYGVDTYGYPVSVSDATVSALSIVPIFKVGRVFNVLGSTGRVVANNLMEEMAMKSVVENPNLGVVIMPLMSDVRWLGWSKMQYTVTSGNGTKVVIHYVAKIEKGVIKAVDDFKFQ